MVGGFEPWTTARKANILPTALGLQLQSQLILKRGGLTLTRILWTIIANNFQSSVLNHRLAMSQGRCGAGDHFFPSVLALLPCGQSASTERFSVLGCVPSTCPLHNHTGRRPGTPAYKTVRTTPIQVMIANRFPPKPHFRQPLRIKSSS